jgi:flagellar biosynthesis chaperone FliJ
MPDPLNTLLRLRRLAVDEARQALADCLRTEAERAAEMRALDDAVDRETVAACDLAADDKAVEAFAVWLKRTRAERAAAAEALLRAEARTQEARAVLSVGERAKRVVVELQATREVERLAEDLKRDQIRIDEVAARRPREGLS